MTRFYQDFINLNLSSDDFRDAIENIMNYSFPFAYDFSKYVTQLNLSNPRSSKDVMSRVNSVYSGYKPKDSTTSIQLISSDLMDCWNLLPNILVSKKQYQALAYQIVLAIISVLDSKVRQNLIFSNTLQSTTSAFVHYYKFLRNYNLAKKKTKQLTPQNISYIQTCINNVYATSKSIAFTQDDIRDKFRNRMHSQNRLYNKNLLFPISLIEKIVGGRNILYANWTDNAIDDIEFLVSPNVKKTIKFMDVVLFVAYVNNSTSRLEIWDKHTKKHTVYTRKYKVIEERPIPLEIHDINDPFQSSVAIDHRTPMSTLLEYHNKSKDVPDLQQLSNDFNGWIISQGKTYINGSNNQKAKDWITKHPYINGSDIICKDTFPVLIEGFMKHLQSNNLAYPAIFKDLFTLHTPPKNSPNGLEIMDKYENKKKSDY